MKFSACQSISFGCVQVPVTQIGGLKRAAISSYKYRKLHLSHHDVVIKVRGLGKILNVSKGFLKRHPFPGPGLAVRVLGEVTRDNALRVLQQVSTLFDSM